MKPDDIALSSMIARWFAAIGTVGALPLALALLLRENLRGRRAPVDALVVWIDTVSRPREGDASNRGPVRASTEYNHGYITTVASSRSGRIFDYRIGADLVDSRTGCVIRPACS